jgi:hypothetical protein
MAYNSRLVPPNHDGPAGIGTGNWIVVAASLSLIFCTMARAADTGTSLQRLPIPDPLWSLREMYPGLAVPKMATESTREFRPRVNSLQPPESDAYRMNTSRALQITTAWQRLTDFRSRGGVRMLTLLESTGGTVSLQAGRHGDPSLQWSSRTMNRGGASRGLLDHLFTEVTHGARDTLQAAAPAAPSFPPARPIRPAMRIEALGEAK